MVTGNTAGDMYASNNSAGERAGEGMNMEWISTKDKDRLPKDGTKVLLATRNGGLYVVEYHPADKSYPWHGSSGMAWNGTGAYWQPTPPLPTFGKGG